MISADVDPEALRALPLPVLLPLPLLLRDAVDASPFASACALLFFFLAMAWLYRNAMQRPAVTL
jgi:uncharacterized membrane protein